MSNKVEKDIEQFEILRKRIAGNKKASHDFLVKAGIITTKGTLKAQYKQQCTPHELA
jgi:hypothetical protein